MSEPRKSDEDLVREIRWGTPKDGHGYEARAELLSRLLAYHELVEAGLALAVAEAVHGTLRDRYTQGAVLPPKVCLAARATLRGARDRHRTALLAFGSAAAIAKAVEEGAAIPAAGADPETTEEIQNVFGGGGE